MIVKLNGSYSGRKCAFLNVGKASLTIQITTHTGRNHRNIMNASESFAKIHTTPKTSSRPHIALRASWGAQVVKSHLQLQETRDTGLIAESGRSPGGGHNNPLWYSCLRIPLTEKPMGYSPWVASWTWLKLNLPTKSL